MHLHIKTDYSNYVLNFTVPLNPLYGKSTGCYSEDCFTCSKSCKVNARDVFRNSKYSKFMDYERAGKESIVIQTLLENNKPLDLKEKILSYLPKTDMPVDMLRELVINIIRSL